MIIASFSQEFLRLFIFSCSATSTEKRTVNTKWRINVKSFVWLGHLRHMQVYGNNAVSRMKEVQKKEGESKQRDAFNMPDWSQHQMVMSFISRRFEWS